jgi:heme-degrading monooxygenase HmoA
MAKVMATFTVLDLDNWKIVYDAAANVRRAAGWQSTQIYPNEQNPNELVLVHEWDSEENFKAFSNSPQLMELQTRAGVSNINGYLLTSVIY